MFEYASQLLFVVINLSLLQVEHYRIYQTAAGLTCDQEEFFANLIQLVSVSIDILFRDWNY